MADEFDPYSKGVEYQVTKVDPTDPTTKGAVYQVHKVDEVTAAMSGKFYRARVIKNPDASTVKGKVYQIVIIDDPDDPSVKGKVYNAIVTGDQEVAVVGPAVPPLDLDNAVANTLTYVKAYGGLLQSNVPFEYTQVDYAIKKGTAGVQGKFDTGIKPTVDDVKIEMKVKIGDEAQQAGQSTVGSFYACQARATASGDITGISGSSASGSINGMQNGQSVASGIIRIKDHIDLIRYEYKNGNHSIYVKDLTTNTEDTQTGTYTFGAPSKNLYIFGNTTITNNLNNNNALYYCKIWVSGSLAFDAVPVIRDSDNKVGLYDKVSESFIEPIIEEGGGFVAGDVTAPTPSDPMDLYCNNGKIKVLDKSQWTIFTNPTSIAGQGVFINSTGKWCSVDDRGAGCAIPLTVGKQYTLVIHKKTTELSTMLRYGQSPQANPTSAGIQLTDWYRGGIEDGQMISFVAKQPYLVMQLSAAAVEAGMVQEAIEVLEAQGGDYTFLKYIEATGTQYIETGLSGPARWVGAGQGTSDSTGSKCILSAKATDGSDIKGAVIWLGSRYASAELGKKWTLGGAGTGISMSTVDTTAFAKYDVTFADDEFIGKINDETFGTVTNSWSINEWRIGTSFAVQTGNPTYYFIGNIYRQQAYQNNVLVGDFIPAIRNSDNVVGMYDTVSDTFFTNAGSGTFVAGTPLGSGEVLELTPSNDTAGVANLLKLNTYVDTQEILTGLISHQLGIVVLNGLETYNIPYSFYIHTDSCDAYTTLDDAQPVQSQNSIGICTQLKLTAKDIWSLAAGYPNTFVFNSRQLHLNFAHDVIGTTSSTTQADAITAIKSYLAAQYAAGTPVIVVYPIATAQDEVAPVPQTMQVVAGDNVLSIVQAGMPGLEVEAEYTKED